MVSVLEHFHETLAHGIADEEEGFAVVIPVAAVVVGGNGIVTLEGAGSRKIWSLVNMIAGGSYRWHNVMIRSQPIP